MVKHGICHIEWSATDLKRAQKFLGGLFNWKFRPSGEGYLLFDSPDGIGGGLMKVEKVKKGRSPMIYIEVEKIEPYLARAGKLGGTVIDPKKEIPGIGWYAHLGDPDGNIVGLYQRK